MVRHPRPFRTSLLIGAMTSPAVWLCLATIVWFGSRSYVVPLIAGFATVGIGALVGQVFRDQAWAFIPRRRQDRHRSLPAMELAKLSAEGFAGVVLGDIRVADVRA
jgi:uncharacterized membrane protein